MRKGGIAMIVISLLLCAHFVKHEVYQIASDNIVNYFSDGWNCLHSLTNIFVIVTSVLQAASLRTEDSSSSISTSCSSLDSSSTCL